MGFRAGFFGVDELRYRIEQMHPAVHLLSPTTSTGSHAVEHYGKAKDLPDLDQADRRTQCYLEHPDAPLPQRTTPTWSHPSRRSYRPGAAEGPAVQGRRHGDRPGRQPTEPHAPRTPDPRPYRPDRNRSSCMSQHVRSRAERAELNT